MHVKHSKKPVFSRVGFHVVRLYDGCLTSRGTLSYVRSTNKNRAMTRAVGLCGNHDAVSLGGNWHGYCFGYQ